MTFSNFWCNVSRITLGPNVSDETLKVIADALKKASEKAPK